MKHFFIDTNVIIDLIADRKPYSKFAVQLFDAAEKKKLKLFTSSHSIATAYYILNKNTDEKTLRKILDDLMDYVQPIAVDQQILKRALNSNHKDFEDGIQIIAASTIDKMDCIVTRNVRDFKLSEIMVLAPDQAVGEL